MVSEVGSYKSLRARKGAFSEFIDTYAGEQNNQMHSESGNYTFVSLYNEWKEHEILCFYSTNANVYGFQYRDGVFFHPNPHLSPLISYLCRCRGLIRYLALTNIILDNTAALRKKVPASKLVFNSFLFFILLKRSIYFYMALHHSAYAMAYHVPCVTR